MIYDPRRRVLELKGRILESMNGDEFDEYRQSLIKPPRGKSGAVETIRRIDDGKETDRPAPNPRSDR